LVVVLDDRCRKVWSTRLQSPPVSLKCIPPNAAPPQPAILVGCDNGDVVFLDAQAEIVGKGQVTGRPTHVQLVPTSAGPLIVLATNRGAVAGYVAAKTE
jgi:hypothetical protein